jgi:nitrite reductase/ring-hydroxylating ferredoxin subunit/uncharacterized membrane protein
VRAREVIERIEGADGLEPLATRMATVAEPAIGTGLRRDMLTGRWLGHPTHPMVVVVPIGCWLGAAIVDWFGGSGGQRIARRLIGVGLMGAVPAAASGTADWLDTSGAERRVGTTHAIANVAATTLFGASWLVRRMGATGAGRVLSGAGLAAVGAAGYLGGHLAYARGVGVNTTAFQSGPDEWTVVRDIEDLPLDTPVRIVSGSIQLVAVRRLDGVDVLEDRCTHRGGPLSGGAVEHDCVECPWHGSRFTTRTGEVRRGPASIPQPAYESRVRDGRVEIRRTETGDLRRNPVGAHVDSG